MQYFAQDEATRLDPTLTVYETLASAVRRSHMVPMIRDILGGFLFSGDDVYKRVGVLSGGERTRLAVARMLLRPSNTLLLDEPTNHLDLDSKDVLLDALVDYGGTLIVVSHDRYFIDKLATKIVEVGGGKARRSTPARTRSFTGAGRTREKRRCCPTRSSAARRRRSPRRRNTRPVTPGRRRQDPRPLRPGPIAKPTTSPTTKRADADASKEEGQARKALGRASPNWRPGSPNARSRSREVEAVMSAPASTTTATPRSRSSTGTSS